ncbi:MAG: YceI family protein [Geobacteraceae bacterium]|nr:YceI family protein [Geobacteraceae bacterium]
MAQWTIDPDHSVAAFSVRHMMVCDVHGQFNKVSGSLSFDPAAPEISSVEATIEVASLYTGIQKRDDHLRSPDFFDVAGYPLMTFASSRVEGRGENRFTVIGSLTMRGVTRPVVLEAEYRGPVKSPFGDETTIGFTATTTIDRTDFGVSWNEMMEGGGLVVGNRVTITLDLEADLVG